MNKFEQKIVTAKTAKMFLEYKIESYKKKANKISNECKELRYDTIDNSMWLKEDENINIDMLLENLDDINSRATEHCVSKINEIEKQLEFINEFINSKEEEYVEYKTRYVELIEYLNNTYNKEGK